ncbi:MAG: response regulator transcription factor [Nocardioides sp.]
MPRVLVVDDEVNLARAVRDVLERLGHVVDDAHDGLAALSAAATFAPDLVILDLGLPDMDGIEVTTRLRSWYAAPILILSGMDQEERKVAALEAGADDYLVKPFGVRELVARVNALLRRPGAEPAAQHLRFGDLGIDVVERRVEVAGKETRLTPTEWRLLEGFATNPGKLLTHRWLLAHAWDDSYGGETRQALRVHLRSLRAKIDDDASSPRYIRTESGAGYRWVATTEAAPSAPAAAATAGSVGRASAPVRAGRATEISHDVNNALAAIQFSLHRVADLAPALGVDAETVGHEVRRVDRLVLQVGDLVSELRGLTAPD